MPGNDSGDRVHNFFPQDNLLQGNYHQQTIEGNWSVANNNFWVGGQIGLPNTSTKNDNIQHSVTSRGQSSHPLHGQSALNITQTSSNVAHNFIQRQPLNSYGYMFGNHVNQERQDDTNILAADTISGHHNLVSRGLSMYESQGPSFYQHQPKPLVRSETSESPLTFNLFGNQQQMHYPQSSMPQSYSFQKHQSGLGDMQQLQQQIMLRNMQELQREQQLRQPDGLQQNAAPFSKQLTGSYPSAMVNGPLRADSQNSRCRTESGNTNWLQHASSIVQGSPNRFVTSENQGKAQSSISSGVHQGDQSVYRDTFSGSRSNITQFSEITTENPSVERVTAFTNNTPANRYQVCVGQTSMQEESMTSRLGFPVENPFRNPPGRYVQQVNPMKKTASSQEINLEVAHSQEKTLSEDVASQNEVSLDPGEARILYGSEDNIWAAFGKSLDDFEDVGGPVDQFQSGTWSALMQSAVAETSSNDVGQQEALGGSSQREGSNISSPGVLQNAITDVHPTHRSVLHSGVPETNIGSYRGPWPPPHSGLRDQNGKSSVYNPSESAVHIIDATMQEPENPSLHSQDDGQKTGMKREVGHGGIPFDYYPMPSSITDVDHTKSLSGNIPVTLGGYIANNAAARPNFSSTQSNESSQAQLWRNINSTAFSYGSGSVDRPHNYIELENQRADSSLNSRGKANANTSEMENRKQNDSSNNSYCSDMSHNNSSGGVKGNVMSDVSDSHSLPSGKKQYLNHNKIGRGNSGPQKFQSNSMGNMEEDTQHHHLVNNTAHSLMSQQSTDFESLKAFSQVPKGSFDLEKGQPGDKKNGNGVNDTCGNITSHIHNSAVPFNQHVDICTPVKDTQSSSQNMLELLNKIDQSRGHGLLMHSSSSGGHNVSSDLHDTENGGSSASCMQQNHTSTSQIFGVQLGPPSRRTSLPSQSFVSQGFFQKENNSHQSPDASDNGERGQSQLPSSPVAHSLPLLSKREFNPIRSALPGQVNPAVTHKIQGRYLSTSSSDCLRSRSPFQYQPMVKDCGQVSKNQQELSHSIQKNDLVSRSSSIGQATDTALHKAAWNSQLDDSDISKGTSNQTTAQESHFRDLVPPTTAKDVSVSQAMNRNAQQGTSFEMLPHMWSNIPGQPQSLSSYSRRASSNVWQLHQPNVLESNSFPHKHGEQESIGGHSSPSVSGSSSMNKGSPAQQDSIEKVNMAQRVELQRPEPTSNNFSDCSPSNSVSMQKGIEVFGKSLMSNSSHQNYSLLHQMGIIKSAETDPYERARKRIKSTGSDGECQQLISTAAKSIDNAVGQNASVYSGDSKILSFSGLADNAGSKAYGQPGNVISQNIHASTQENSRFNHDGNNPTPVKVDHLSISSQMTPSWLIKHGGSRNGHMLTGYDAQRGTGSNTSEPLSSHGKRLSGVHISNSNEPVAADDIRLGEISNIQQSPTPISAAVEPQSLVLDVKISKKPERATFQLTSWCKEVSVDSQNPQTISMAELFWAKAANRLTEKIEDEVKVSVDGVPILGAKRRFILTTQLMQQLLSPPKSAILSSEAELNFDGVVYFVSRLALGEACGLLPHLNSDSDKSHHVVSLFSGNYNELEKGNERHLSKLVEGFMGRSQKLESAFLRVDNRASLVDVRSECQELEKFSVINRFAKFHGRGQAVTGDASSSSNGAANALKPYPQRYVTALPVPRNLPDRVHCLSL